jgi:hypothetical protein
LSAVALGLTLGFLLTPVGMAHLDLAADVCASPPVTLSEGDAGVQAVVSPHQHDHCFTCHWLQSFRSTLLPSGAVAIEASGTCLLPADRATRVASTSRHAVPARAPPHATFRTTI